MIADADGSNPAPLFSQDLPKIITYPAWSPDGSQLAFTYRSEAGATEGTPTRWIRWTGEGLGFGLS